MRRRLSRSAWRPRRRKRPASRSLLRRTISPKCARTHRAHEARGSPTHSSLLVLSTALGVRGHATHATRVRPRAVARPTLDESHPRLQHVSQLFGIAHDVHGADAPVFDIYGGRGDEHLAVEHEHGGPAVELRAPPAKSPAELARDAEQ